MATTGGSERLLYAEWAAGTADDHTGEPPPTDGRR